jgi:acyl-CoA thioesterase I
MLMGTGGTAYRLWTGRHGPLLLLFAAATLAGACRSPTPPGPASNAAIRRVVVLGDSLAVTPTVAESFPSRLNARIQQQGQPWIVTNAAISGDTTADGVRRLSSLLTSDVGVLVVELGANDGLQGVDVATVERNLLSMVATGQEHNTRVLLCGMETPPTRGLDYSLAFHFVFPRVASARTVPLVPFLLAGVALVPELNGPDGVHPNAAGAQRIADSVWPYLQPLLSP